ncbi:MAG: hypothetical protein JWL73_730, partial [Actinomycetia bacterium]|nr:hypothetical protein [Actinomycetes bacterium]
VRDLARHQARAAATLAAITLSISIAVGTVVIASASRDRPTAANLSNRELLIQVGDPRTSPNPDLTATQRADLDRRAARVIATLGRGATSAPLDVAVSSDPAVDPARREPIALGFAVKSNGIDFRGYPYVATPQVLALYGIDAASVHERTDVLSASNEPRYLVDVNQVRGLAKTAPPTQRVTGLPSQTSAPSSLITEAAMRRHGWVPARSGWIVESTKPLTASQIAAARSAAAAAGLAIETRTAQAGLSSVRAGATLIGALLALAIAGMALALLRGESARDVRTLTATGAGATTRRALSASTAAALVVPGVVLGTVGAYVALLAAFRTDLGRLAPVPVVSLLTLVVGLPLAATAAGWLLAGREPRTFARQDLD